MQGLSESYLDYLRVEKIGNIYSVRLGKFKDYTTAAIFLETINPPLDESLIVKTSYSDDKIIRLYKIGERPIL